MKYNQRQQMDGVGMLASLDAEAAALVFFDPQYRAVLDRMAYGNEGARQKGRARLPHMNTDTIKLFMGEIERTLKASGYVLLWADKFSIVESIWRTWLPAGTSLRSVDMVCWNKARIGMGRRLRNQVEFCVVLQKEPVRAKGTWTDHTLGDCWLEGADRAIHPHAKPLQLIQRIIRATTRRGDLVVDPAAGGYCVLEACRATGRQFLGCDLVGP